MTVEHETATLSEATRMAKQSLNGTATSVTDNGATRRGSRLIAAGGLLAALGAASCCVIPFALFTLGVSGAWIGNLTALEPYQPLFALLALGLVGYGAYRVYSKRKADCLPGAYCANSSSDRLAKIGLWAATGLVIVAVGFPYIIRTIAF